MAESEDTQWGRLKRNLGYEDLWEEVSGSVGDLGTFLPIVLALVLVNGIDLGTTLLFTGAYNVITGLIFGVPMPVQPMKSIAAVAITEGDPLTVNQIMAAGLSTAFILAFLGITGLMSVVNRVVPLPVVRGVQLSQGIAFGITAVKYILKEQDLTTSKATGKDRPWLGLDGLLLALSALCFIVLASGAGGGGGGHECGTETEGLLEDREEESMARRERRRNEGMSVGLPTALLVFSLGGVLAIARDPSAIWTLRFGPSVPRILNITKSDWEIGFVRAAIPQIPLSILNSVIAVCKLSNDLFPRKDVSPFKVSVSVGLMNLVGCWWGAMPVCHGAGGLAGQYRFGAQTGTAVVFLGTAKMLLALVLGSSLVKLLALYPIGLLGVLLFFSGLELAMACRDQTSRSDAFVMLTVTVVSLTNSSSALGFGCGLALATLLYIRDVDFWARLWRRASRLVSGNRRGPPGYESFSQTP